MSSVRLSLDTLISLDRWAEGVIFTESSPVLVGRSLFDPLQHNI